MTLVNNPLLQLTGAQQHLWNEFEDLFPTETQLIGAAIALGAAQKKPWSEQENSMACIAKKAIPLSKANLDTLRELIRAGYDPLGEAFCTLRSPADRREHGATYTPGPIVHAMMEWAADRKKPG